MWWSIVGLGGSCFISSTDKKIALKGYQVWEDGEEVHPGINSLRLEYAPPGDGIRLRMAIDTALGLSHIHARKLQHCDISCRNLFLIDNYRVKIGDFGGSLEPAYELPFRGREFWGRPARGREIFALGSVIYEIMAWALPYEGLEDDEIEKKYESVDKVVEALQAFIASQDDLDSPM
ncbi:hypothetical protein BKA61DRAFT_719918 [Leptodontidium sp. MPI-SDFR-AT-0119]|nr:hypothetical protein BKA61DRAFT_719918 [Leptodontidium sp. MPI-SDFR-AT-0119]